MQPDLVDAGSIGPHRKSSVPSARLANFGKRNLIDERPFGLRKCKVPGTVLITLPSGGILKPSGTTPAPNFKKARSCQCWMCPLRYRGERTGAVWSRRPCLARSGSALGECGVKIVGANGRELRGFAPRAWSTERMRTGCRCSARSAFDGPSANPFSTRRPVNEAMARFLRLG